jgi:hypothetical protein
MIVERDVAIDVGADELPLRVDEGRRRQRPERGPIPALEQLAAAGAVAPHAPCVEIREQVRDPRIEGGEGEQRLVTEAGEDPPFGDLNTDFRFRLAQWFASLLPARSSSRSAR